MGKKVKKVGYAPKKKNLKPSKEEQKLVAKIKCGAKPSSEKESRFNAYVVKMAEKRNVAKKAAASLGKKIYSLLKLKATEEEEAEVLALLKSEEITKYAEKNKCSRSVARKRMSKERRENTTKAAA